MSDIRKVCLLVLDYNRGDLNAYQLIDLASEILNECDEGTINVICGLFAYRGTKDELVREYKRLQT
jgi:hypothetical protein